MSKKAILVVSFGTSYKKGLINSIEATENAIKKEFGDFEVRRAFTSVKIIRKLIEKENYYVDDVSEALVKLYNHGYEEVYVQPLYIIFGEEYDKLQETVHEFKGWDYFKVLELSTPLLYKNQDYINVVEALREELNNFDKREAIVLMAHGTNHPSNACYFQLQWVIRNRGFNNTYMATVEGYPNIEEIVPCLKGYNYSKINIIPLMFTCGYHVKKDMISDNETSWKTILTREGFEVNCSLKGIGELEKIQQLYIKLLHNTIKNN